MTLALTHIYIFLSTNWYNYYVLIKDKLFLYSKKYTEKKHRDFKKITVHSNQCSIVDLLELQMISACIAI